MIDNILRFREPATWLVLAVTVAGMVLALVRSGVHLVTGGSGAIAASQDVANSAMNLTLVVVIVALVNACLFIRPASPRALAVARASALVVTTGTILTLVAMVIGLTASAGALGVILEALGGLLDFVLKFAASVVLWLMARALRAGRLDLPTAAAPAAPVVEAPAGDDRGRQAPTWRPSEASGSVWRTASDAAEGAPAAGHGAPGTGTWHRVERPKPSQEPDPGRFVDPA